MALNFVGSILPPFLMGLGQFKASFRNTAFGAILFPIAYAAGSPWGINGVCVAALLAYPVQWGFWCWCGAVRLPRRDDAGGFLRPLVRLPGRSAQSCIAVCWVLRFLPRAPLGLSDSLLECILGVMIYRHGYLLNLLPAGYPVNSTDLSASVSREKRNSIAII